MKKIIGVILLIITIPLMAQEIEMADKFRSDGKIYVVISIVLSILVGLFIYLVMLDRRIGKTEEKIKNK